MVTIVLALSNYPLSYLLLPDYPYNSLAGLVCGGRRAAGFGGQV